MFVLLNSHMVRFVCRSFPHSWVVRTPLSVKATRNTPLPSPPPFAGKWYRCTKTHRGTRERRWRTSPWSQQHLQSPLAAHGVDPTCCMLTALISYFVISSLMWRGAEGVCSIPDRMLCLKQSYYTLHSVSYSAVLYSLCPHVRMYVCIYTCTLFIYSFSV